MHTATYYIDLLLSGITVGSLYALIAIGYTMVYGILRLINFAHGDIFMMAGFFMVYISASMPMAVAIPVVLIMTVALGLLIERAAYKPLRSAPRMSVMISAIGVSYLLQNLATYITGGLARPYPEIPFLKGTFMLGALKIKIITVVTPLLTILLVIALVIFINHTKTGMAMRAVSRDFDTARLMGIKVNNIISVTFIIGSFLAGVGSILYFSNYGQVSPTIGAMPGLKAFVAAVFGGIGSIPGAVLGAYIIGICESLIKANDAIAIFSNAFTFALLILVLLFKPNGMFGEKLAEKV
ncbi:MAG: branched-chain amino acid ABC transporter permease [Clostridiales bacterium]|nr:MAG: branched-chain amino acid ABC transporter permease [Clostridiales bacterium]